MYSAGASQSEVVKALGYQKMFSRNYISAFELGTREPPLPVLLAYAKLVDISTDVLIDDSIDFQSRKLRM